MSWLVLPFRRWHWRGRWFERRRLEEKEKEACSDEELRSCAGRFAVEEPADDGKEIVWVVEHLWAWQKEEVDGEDCLWFALRSREKPSRIDVPSLGSWQPTEEVRRRMPIRRWRLRWVSLALLLVRYFFHFSRFLEPDEDDYEDEDYRRKKKRAREEKLDTMDRKLKAMENLIIEDTAKYYGNHEGMLCHADNVVSRKQLKCCSGTLQAVSARRRHALFRAVLVIASPQLTVWRRCEKPSKGWSNRWTLKRIWKGICWGERNWNPKVRTRRRRRSALRWRRRKRSSRTQRKMTERSARNAIAFLINFFFLAQLLFQPLSHDIDAPSKKATAEHHENDLSEDASKKKKRSQKKSEISNYISDEAPMSEGDMGGRVSSECPILDSIEKKCRGIDIMSGDSNQNLLEACGAHQLCYLCVSALSFYQSGSIQPTSSHRYLYRVTLISNATTNTWPRWKKLAIGTWSARSRHVRHSTFWGTSAAREYHSGNAFEIPASTWPSNRSRTKLKGKRKALNALSF